jgi:hypothetical protein
MSEKGWFGCTLVMALAFCLLAAGFNYIVDPWGLSEAVSIPGFNERKPEPLTVGRLHKAYGALRVRPVAVAMGTSTAEHGINMEHPAWRGFEPAYNYSFPGATIAEIRTFLEQAHRHSPIKRAVIGLELSAFNAHRTPNAQSEQALEAMENPLARIRPFFTRGMLAASFDTILHQPVLGAYFMPNGQSSPQAFEQWRDKRGGSRNLFVTGVRQTVRGLMPRPAYRFELQRGGEPATLEEVRDLLAFARREGIELQFFISPVHAWQLETIRAIGLWPSFEYWKQQLARIIGPDSGATGAVLWDFADYGALTNEDVPPAGDPAAQMRWFWDSLHYKAALGDVVQDRMAGTRASGVRAPVGYGVRIDAQTVDEHLLQVRERQAQYRATHPADIAEIEALTARELQTLRGSGAATGDRK